MFFLHIKTVQKSIVPVFVRKEFASRFRLHSYVDYLPSRATWGVSSSSLYGTTDVSSTTHEMPGVPSVRQATKVSLKDSQSGLGIVPPSTLNQRQGMSFGAWPAPLCPDELVSNRRTDW